MAKKKIPFAIAYDFDGTLAPGNMQERNFIPAIDKKPESFWREAKRLARRHEGDEILAYMGLMIKEAKAKDVRIRKENFLHFGKKLSLFRGLTDYQDKDKSEHKGWFKRIDTYAEESGIKADHYIISSGLREMIEGSAIGRVFKKIYASAFQFDVNEVAEWPALSVNYTTKTQYLFRINKGSLDVHDHSVINRYIPDSERPVPFRNIVFVGDGDTDIPAFRLVKELGGIRLPFIRRVKEMGG